MDPLPIVPPDLTFDFVQFFSCTTESWKPRFPKPFLLHHLTMVFFPCAGSRRCSFGAVSDFEVGGTLRLG